MKTGKLIMLSAAMFLGVAASLGQQLTADQVPQEVLTSFREKFPDASGVTWAKEMNLNYEASFVMATNTQRAEFDKNGLWVETENSINADELPKDVSKAVLKKNPSCKIADAEEIQSANEGKIYEVGCAVKSGKSDYRVTIDGKIVATLIKKF